jgi:iron complex transport system substrate-binding protein
MGQQLWSRSLAILVIGLACAGCERSGQSTPATPPTSAPATTQLARPTVASLVPAATDLILGMGAGEHLVAVSTFDVERDGTRGLPKVGDYQNFDWEQLSVLKPNLMIVFMAPDRMSAALKQRASDLNIELMNIKVDRLDQVYHELNRLGAALDEPAKAAAAEKRLRDQLDAVQKRVAGKPRVRTLIVREVSAEGAVGRDSFIDDVLQIAGGENVLPASLGAWPTIDRETMVSTNPDAVLHLLPLAPPQAMREAEDLWKQFPDLPAVKNGRVYLLTEWHVQQPGYQIGKLAEIFADKLHPDTAGAK